MRHLEIITANCKRCGKPVATTLRSLFGMNQLKTKCGIICDSCITPDERHQMTMDIGDILAGITK